MELNRKEMLDELLNKMFVFSAKASRNQDTKEAYFEFLQSYAKYHMHFGG